MDWQRKKNMTRKKLIQKLSRKHVFKNTIWNLAKEKVTERRIAQ